jgi:SAM-dependent methyltransferase
MLPLLNTDRHWERFAQADPYWAVLTNERFRSENLDRQEFFETGERHIDYVFNLVRQHLDPDFAPRSALDFGCGVGRLLLPLARRVPVVTGVDVSETMLREARCRLDEASLQHIDLVVGDDELSEVQGTYDLIHSVMVFQHVPVRRGEVIVRRLLSRMNDGAVGALQFVYSRQWRPGLHGRWQRLRERLYHLRVALLGQPQMQMNEYSLGRLVAILQQAGARRLHVELNNHGGILGAMLVFQLRASDQYVI